MDRFLDWFLSSALSVLQKVKDKRDAANKAESEKIHADVQKENTAARGAAGGGGS